MFTGIVEELGTILAIVPNEEGAKLHITPPSFQENLYIGQSISVNGCCVTITDIAHTHWTCDVVKETLSRTNLKYLNVGSKINLERAMPLQGRLDGHLVQGHVDETGQILHKKSLADDSWWLTVSASSSFLRYLIPKGSVAIDGVSLTIAELQETNFSFAMIPHTASLTTLGYKQVNDYINLEIDMIAKYIERFVALPREIS